MIIIEPYRNVIGDYSTFEFNFRYEIEKLLYPEKGLERLHDCDLSVNNGVFGLGADQKTIWHDRFYALDMNGGFMQLYRRFIKQVVKPAMYCSNKPIVYQRKPTFRVQYCNNIGVAEFHKDGDYHHNKSETNFWIPVTRTFGNNSIWVESVEGGEDYHPVAMLYGQYLQFPGIKLKHGNRINDTKQTRVSFDFRVIPFEDYKEEGGESVVRGVPFKIGGYYEVMQ